MSCSKFLQNFRSELLQKFVDSFENDNQNTLFIGIGRILPWSRDSIEEIKNPLDSASLGDDRDIPPVGDTDREKSSLKRNMIFMKQILPKDISFLVPRYSWESGTVYDNYRDDQELFDPRKRFFVYNETTKGVYKCLDNNKDSTSTLIPSVEDNNLPFLTSDGYTWKLMYRVSDDLESRFQIRGFGELDEFVPIRFIDYFPSSQGSNEEIQQKNFQDSAVGGSIEFVDVNQIFKDSIILDTERCAIGKNTCVLFEAAITGATSAKLSPCVLHPPIEDNYLENLVFNAKNETSDVQRRVIRESKFVTIFDDSGVTCNQYIEISFQPPLDVALPVNTEFDIEPWIRVIGDGTAKNGVSNTLGLNTAEFKPLFFGESNVLDYIKVVDTGKDYSYAKAIFQGGIDYPPPSSTVDIQKWEDNYFLFLNPVLPPEGGHGSNPLKELGSSDLALLTLIQGNEENKITPTNDFRQIFIVKNPILNNPVVHLRFSTEKGESLQLGTQISSSSNTGIVKRIFEYSAGTTGFEILVEGISGSFFGATSISYDGGTNTIDNSSRFSDGYKSYEIGGTENKTLLKLEIDSRTTFQGKPRDVVMGVGATSGNFVAPSFASGMIRKLVDRGSNLEVFLEDYSGKFNIGERLLLIPRTSSSPPTLQDSSVRFFSFEKENLGEIGYSLVTKLEISTTDINFTQNSFGIDQAIYSYPVPESDPSVLNEQVVGSGHLFNFRIVGGQTAELEVVGARYKSFRVGDFIPYNVLQGGDIAFSTINKVVESEIRYDSGEVLYMNNISPVARTSANRDQINLVIST